MVFPTTCFAKWFAWTDSQASSPRSIASSKDDYDRSAIHEERCFEIGSSASSRDDYDWSEIDEERLECLPCEWHRRSAVLIRGQDLLSAVLRTWRQLCSIDAEITDAMYQQRLLRNAFAAWRIAAIVDMEFSSFASES
jgi:hypothetical protein